MKFGSFAPVFLLFAATGCIGGQDETPPVKAGTAVSSDPELPVNLWTRGKGDDWPTFLGPGRNGTSKEKGIRTQWPNDSLPIVWQHELGIGYGVGTVSRGRFFQFDRYGSQARLTCMHAETGTTLWQFEYPTDYVDMYGYNGGPRCSPVIDGGRVYLYGVEGMLHCLRVSDGKMIWKCDTAERFGVIQNFFGVGSTPVIDQDLLIVMVGGSPEEDQNMPPGMLDRVSGNGTGIVAFDKLTGEVKYAITDELASYSSPVTATIDGRRWCFAFCRGGLVGFEPEKGSVDFHYPWRDKSLESVNASVPVVVGNEVFISETYGLGSSLLRVKPGGYDVVWKDDRRRRDKAMKTHWNTPIYRQGYLYGCSGRNSPDAELRCIEWKTGKIQWSVPNAIHTTLTYIDGHFLCLEEKGRILLIKANPQRCEIVARCLLRDDHVDTSSRDGGLFPRRLLQYPCWAAPVVSHGLLYVRGKTRLVCLELIPNSP